MPLSYSLIKNDSAYNSEQKVINTEYKRKDLIIDEGDCQETVAVPEIDYEAMLKSYENIGANIVKKAKEDSETILVIAADKATAMEKEAYEKGYAQGKANGYEDGYAQGKSEIAEHTESEVKARIEQAENTLNRAKADYLNYLEDKKNEIIDLAFEMAKKIVRRELVESDGLISLLEESLELSKGEDNILIKVNPQHGDSIREKADYWKTSYSIQGEIFILEDTDIEEGNAIVQRTSGKDILGMNIGLERIEEVLYDRHKL